MLTALVIADEVLGRAVSRSLETARPSWLVRRGVSGAHLPAPDVVIVDEALLDQVPHRPGSSAAVLVIGRDLEKPFSIAQLRAAAVACAGSTRTSDELVAVDPPLLEALRMVELAAPRGGSVLILGPSGVGKESLARRVHRESGRRGQFVALNCAALVDGLVETTLFGHVRGAFTGAHRAVDGAFVQASGGTLFLDEVGELSAQAQAKLLRVLEQREVVPVGASRAAPVDARIVAATNRDLRADTGSGAFREDLYFRLATFVVGVPALCERPSDLAALVQRFTCKHDRSAVLRLGAEARELLLAYGWPGNVRELNNVLERLMSLGRPGTLSAAELLQLAPELGRAPRARASTPPSATLGIDEALRRCSGRRDRAAADLGIHRSTLWRRMKRGA